MEGSAEGTEPDHGPLTPLESNASAMLPPPSEAPLVDSETEKSRAATREKLDLSAADAPVPAPFTLSPIKLAGSLDPKSLETIEKWGGAEGVLRALGTDGTHGLRTARVGRSDGGKLNRVPTGEKAATAAAAGDARLGRVDSGSQPPGGPRGGGDGDGDPNSDAFEASLDDRKAAYGANVLPDRKSKSLLQLMWIALQDRVLVLLVIAAAVSLALGLYQDFGTAREKVACSNGAETCYAPQVDWVEGVAILVAVCIVVIVGSVNDWQKEAQFKVLNAKKEDRGVKVIRDGQEQIINVKDVVVGDIALLEPGEILPVDGLFLRGHNLRCDESGATGESDAVRKASYEDCMAEHNDILKQRAANPDEKISDLKKDPFLISGSKVLEGVGVYVVIAVGERSFNGRIMMGLRGDTPATPLQLKLNALAELIAKLGSLAGLILFSALMIRFFVQLGTNPHRTANAKAISFVQILIIAVTLIVVAVPEGLPLAVTLALAFATKRMTRANLLVRVLGSCETMANATVVCTDKTGTLTQNVMAVVAGSVGVHGKFVAQIDQNNARSPVPEEKQGQGDRKARDDFAFDMKDLNTVLSPAQRELFNAAVTVNSTAFEDADPDTGEMVFVGSKTETALLRFAKELGWADYKKTRESAEIVQVIPFSSERKAMGVVVKLAPNLYRFYIKGASEILTKQCTKYMVVGREHSRDSMDKYRVDGIETAPITEAETTNISRTIIFYANQMLRTIALCYRDFESWPPVQNAPAEDEVPYSYLSQDLTLIGVTGIEDPLRPGVREAVADCQKAGVAIKMCTGDNVLTARSIATQCGIYTPGGIIMEGPAFRQLNEHELQEIVPRLQVLARSSPEDKRILVAALKARGEIVGVTGDGSNDSLALKEAHVGFSMGIAGTEVAKEASDIILMDDNFASIVSAIMWGRCVNDAVKKFLQFQISVNITAVVITFVTAVASNSETSALTAVQLLWINIIMDTFAALALATDPAHPALLNRKPDHPGAPLFSVDMYKMIFGQSIYQIIVILVFHFAGDAIFGYHGLSSYEETKKHTELGTLIFNAFVFMQIFNSVNCRRLDNKLNIFEGILANKFFLIITLIEIGGQILIVFVGGSAFQVKSMNGRDWGISIALGFMSIPIGVAIRYIPSAPCERFLVWSRILPDPASLPTIHPAAAAERWDDAIEQVRDNLATFANLRGGRVRASSFVGKSRQTKMDKAGITLPSLLTMVPTLVATTIGAGWMPTQGGDLSDPAGSDPSRSSAALYDGRITIHPETDKNDPFYRKFAHSGTNLV